MKILYHVRMVMADLLIGLGLAIAPSDLVAEAKTANEVGDIYRALHRS